MIIIIMIIIIIIVIMIIIIIVNNNNGNNYYCRWNRKYCKEIGLMVRKARYCIEYSIITEDNVIRRNSQDIQESS